MVMRKFQKLVYGYYKKYGRDLPWRNTDNPYWILVSEIMLQQTQVSRVLKKYEEFIQAFPTIQKLARAPLYKALKAWQGLGYNRRALLLHRLAQKVVSEYAGKIPSERKVLKSLPGIGEATSGEICAFAFGQPAGFVETNIRSVFIHHFFHDRQKISDKELLPYINKTLDKKNPRQWYYALMDYGVYLKSQGVNPSRRSAHYKRQSPFKGSKRQLRGKILKVLIDYRKIDEERLSQMVLEKKNRIKNILKDLQKEGLISRKGKLIRV